jgi:hypothetical protein
MPLQVRPIAISISVICFFFLSFICWVYRLSAFTCCKRALAGAALAYVLAALAVKAINAILIDAMIKSQMNQRKEKTSDRGN